MPKNLKRLADKPWNTFGTFTAGQKAVTIVAVLGLLLGALFFSRLTGGTSMTPLFFNLSDKKAAAIVAQLDSTKVPYTLDGTTISVPADKVDALRLQMAGAGLADGDSEGGYSSLSSMPVTASKLQQDMAVKQATEGELEKTLEALDGVESAIVHVAVPEKDVFSDSESKPTASVVLETGVGVKLTSGQVRSVTHLVASSVSGMSPDDVTVADGTGRMISTTSTDGTSGSGGDRAEQTAAYESDMVDRLQTLLEPITGIGGAIVRVNADLDYDNTKTVSKSYVAPSPSAPPLSSSTDVEKYTGNGDAATGVLGPDNIAVPKPTGTAAAGNSYDHSKETRDNAYGTVEETKVKAPGDIRGLHIAVALKTPGKDDKNAIAVDPAEIEKLVTQAAGLNTARGDAVVVSQLPFDTSAADATKAEIAAEQALKAKGAMMGYAKTGALVLVLLMTLLLTWLKSKKSRRRMPISRTELVRLEELERRNAELEAEKAQLVLTGSAGSQPALAAAPEPEGDNGEALAKVRSEIGELVDQQPEEVAQLLRGWLADRRT